MAFGYYEAWDELAIAYRDQANNRAGDLPNATKAAQTALSLTQPASPARYDRVITLVQIYQRANKGKEALALVKASPVRHEELAKFPAIAGRTWNYPVIAGGRLLVRNADEMAAFDISPK